VTLKQDKGPSGVQSGKTQDGIANAGPSNFAFQQHYIAMIMMVLLIMETNGITRQKHFNIFHILNRKIRNSFHHSQARTKAQQEERKMKRDNMKKKRYKVWFKVHFDSTMWISSK
jgi:hypothetical protein